MLVAFSLLPIIGSLLDSFQIHFPRPALREPPRCVCSRTANFPWFLVMSRGCQNGMQRLPPHLGLPSSTLTTISGIFPRNIVLRLSGLSHPSSGNATADSHHRLPMPILLPFPKACSKWEEPLVVQRCGEVHTQIGSFSGIRGWSL